jgi:hypothetical protein
MPEGGDGPFWHTFRENRRRDFRLFECELVPYG